jgi:hypothetical protein
MSTITSRNDTPSVMSIVSASVQEQKKFNAKAYLSDISPCTTLQKVAVVATAAGIGAAAGSFGGGKGAAIGAGAGAAVGVVIVIGMHAKAFKKWRSNQKVEVVSGLFQKLSEAINNDELICPITREPVRHPVVTPYTDHVYEKEALEKWVREKGTDPMTRQPLRVEQLQTSMSAMGAMQRICKEIVDRKVKELKLTPKELEGIKAMREDFDKNILNFFKNEKEKWSKKVENKEMSIQDFVAQMQKYADAVEPRTNR